MLLASGSSIDHEKKLLEKLKTRCTASVTRTFKRMLEDIEASTKVNNEFKSSKKSRNIDLSVTVLSESFWPK